MKTNNLRLEYAIEYKVKRYSAFILLDKAHQNWLELVRANKFIECSIRTAIKNKGIIQNTEIN